MPMGVLIRCKASDEIRIDHMDIESPCVKEEFAGFQPFRSS